MSRPRIIIAGHVTIALTPDLDAVGALSDALVPGATLVTEGMDVDTGGAVANVGRACARLGLDTHLFARVGRDALGDATKDLLASDGSDVSGMTADPGQSSATIAVVVPGVDRFFWHYPGPNERFVSNDVPDDALAAARHIHVGYPTVLPQLEANDGRELIDLLSRARRAGLSTSIDVSMQAAEPEDVRLRRRDVLARALPLTDVFLPDFAELVHYFGGPAADPFRAPDLATLDGLTERLIELGGGVVGATLAEKGIYLRTTADSDRLAPIGRGDADSQWVDRRLLTPARRANFEEATGAGDAAFAGFLAEMLEGGGPADALSLANAVGAASTERVGPTQGVPTRAEIEDRLARGWELEPTLPGAPTG